MRIKATDSTLLIVDIQERLFPVILDAAAMAEHTAWLQQVAKRVGVPVLLTEQYSRASARPSPRCATAWKTARSSRAGLLRRW